MLSFVVHHGVESIDDLYALAGLSVNSFQAMILNIAEVVNGEAIFRPGDGLKSRVRVQEKIDRDYSDPLNPQGAKRVIDVLGATVLFNNRSCVEKAIPAIERLVEKNGGQIVRFKNRFDRPASGYRDYMLSIRLENGLVTELLLTTKAMSKAKTFGYGHLLYEIAQKAEDVLNSSTSSEAEKQEAKKEVLLLGKLMEEYYGSTGPQCDKEAFIAKWKADCLLRK